MASRLDRLFILLDKGSNDTIRKAAAKQIGDVHRANPDNLDYLLSHVKEYSCKPNWDTRIAAAHAIRYIIEGLQEWPPKTLKVSNELEDKVNCKLDIAKKLLCDQLCTDKLIREFDIDFVISECPELLSVDDTDRDSGSEQDAPLAGSSKSVTKGRAQSRKTSLTKKKQELQRQRKLINKELGISMVEGLSKSDDIVSNDDLQVEFKLTNDITKATPTPSSKSNEQRLLLESKLSNYKSAIEILSNLGIVDCNQLDPLKTSSGQQECDTKPTLTTWALNEISNEYTNLLFERCWDVRHGGATALREIVRVGGKSAGRRLDVAQSTYLNEHLNQLWLTDIALRAVCVLALDKFADFLFDLMVAPVRESAAQLLGCCVAHLSESNARPLIEKLLHMTSNPKWEVRHGSILGLKYSLNSVSEEFAKTLLIICFDAIFRCLADQVDDVSAEAAGLLMSVKDLIIVTVPDKTVELINFLWDYLADLDELATSTSNIVTLLASLIISSSAQLEPCQLTKSIPRFWYLLSHSSTSVRHSVLRALITLFKPQKTTCLTWMPDNIMTTALQLIFQRSILENVEDIRSSIEEVWMLLTKISDTDLTSAQKDRFNLLRYTSQYLNYWFCLVLQPFNVAIDRAAPSWLNVGLDGNKCDTTSDGEIYIGSSTFNADTMDQQKHQVTKCRLLSAKLLGSLYANLVNDYSGSAESQHTQETTNYLAEMFIYYIKTMSANQRIVSAWTIESWATSLEQQQKNCDFDKMRSLFPKSLSQQLDISIRETNICYDELATAFTRLQQETRDFVAAASSVGIVLDAAFSTTDKRSIYNLNQIQLLCDIDLNAEFDKMNAKRGQTTAHKNHAIAQAQLMNKRVNLNKSLQSTTSSQKTLSTSVLSSLACAHVAWRILPDKLELIIQPLLESIEIEEDETLRIKSVEYLTILLKILANDSEKHSHLIDKVLNRLIDTLVCKSSLNCISIGTQHNGSLTGVCTSSDTDKVFTATSLSPEATKIILLDNLQRRAESSRQQSVTGASISGPGRRSSSTSVKRSHSLTSSVETEFDSELNARAQEVKVQGASIALARLVHGFGSTLPDKLTKFWLIMIEDIRRLSSTLEGGNDNTEPEQNSESTQNLKQLFTSLKLLEVSAPHLNSQLLPQVVALYPILIRLLNLPIPYIRHHSAQCIGIISKLRFDDTIGLIKSDIIGMLDDAENQIARCGALEAVAFIIENIQLGLLPHINFFMIHVLKRMSDQNDQARLMATHCFGKLLSLMPLRTDKGKCDTKVENVDGSADADQIQSNANTTCKDDLKFIEQLLNQSKLDNFVIPIDIKATLRTYQQDGLDWLAFLNRFNLHGILCDEMGLGKTLMTICMVASDHFAHAKTKLELGLNHSTPPSLIICPPTLTAHWLYEIDKFLTDQTRSILNPAAYSGTLQNRMYVRAQVILASERSKSKQPLERTESSAQQEGINIVIASYDTVRTDIDFFKTINWNYCVLDEGHIIKNVKTKLSRSIRLLSARHRLILSGTPIQNSVTELWSLFDFLMPGFLGSERQFHLRYAKPIAQSHDLKCSSRDFENGALAMESLHRQVLPFILRRLKHDVLKDLPPKIIQDYYCELSSLQHKLYEDFTKSKLCNNVTKKSLSDLNQEKHNDGDTSSDLSYDTKNNSSKSHVFQALQYLKNVCNHPKMVLTEKHSQYQSIKKELAADKSSLDDVDHSAKLMALKQLLIDCGISSANAASISDDHQVKQEQSLPLDEQQKTLEPIKQDQHRALVFCQTRKMVDIVAHDLLNKHLPDVSYLRLDGTVPTNQRQSIVSLFNNDHSFNLLLLTTQIGGLGLNLTGADTVIFMEHDWNPTKDLQAIDRAHRIGQNKVVNVYRLITKGTIEEKIMGLQKFKTKVSNTVINRDNAGLETMKVEQIFDLFEDSGVGTCKAQSGSGKSEASFADLLPELWDQQQYETEHDLSNFISLLKN